MIDDFVPAAVTIDGKINPSNDWGYLYDKRKSLYKYIDKNLFTIHPEIKGTFFIPLKSQHYINNNGYVVYKKEFNKEFKKFAEGIKKRFDFAFHGITHKYICLLYTSDAADE